MTPTRTIGAASTDSLGRSVGCPRDAPRGDRTAVQRRRAAWRAALASVALALQGCASTLAPMSAPAPAPRCAPGGQDCLARGRDAFDAYRRAKVEAIRAKSDGYRLPSAPVALLHPVRTDYAVLLVHGLNDSAYYMADIGDLLYGSGANVVTVLLPGHGTDQRDMLDVSAEMWRAEVDLGLDMAALVGRRVIVGGFSLGGALALDAVLRRPDIQGLLLFSPAIRLRSFDGVASLTCAPGLREFEWETELPQNPVKYRYRAGNGVCQLTRIMQRNLAAGDGAARNPPVAADEVRGLARRVSVPTFLALSFADARISPEAALEFAGNASAPVMVATFGRPEGDRLAPVAATEEIRHVADAGLPHSYLVRRSNPYNGQENPCFDRMAAALADFLFEHFHLGAGTGESPLPECRPLGETLKGSD